MKILVLAGGFDQIALIDELKRRGHTVVLVDYLDCPPAHTVADKHIVASTLDVESVVKIAKEEGVDLVCTACTDQALLTVAYVSEQLKLPSYVDYQTGLNITNKAYMKAKMFQYGIPTARYCLVDTNCKINIEGFRYPLVVKPVDCNSSKGVTKVDSPNELAGCIENAINLSRTNKAIVEEFMSGSEISADFYIENGKAILLLATQTIKIRNKKTFTITGSKYPVVDSSQENKLVKIATDISSAFLLDNCPLLVQLIFDGEEYSVIEFSARMGGGSKYKLIETISGVNIMSKYVDRILGKYPSITPMKKVDFCHMVYVYCYPGFFSSIEGMQQLMEDGVVEVFFIYKTKGMQISKAETSGDRVAGYLVIGASETEVCKKISLADSKIKVLASDGSDIMIHNLV